MKLLSAKISLAAALVAALCSCESLTETESPSQYRSKHAEWYQNEVAKEIRITYNNAVSQSSYNPSYTPQGQGYPFRPGVEVYGEPTKGEASKYHKMLCEQCVRYWRYDSKKGWRDNRNDDPNSGPYRLYSAGVDMSWRGMQDILLRLSALGYDGKIEFIGSSGSVWKTLSVSGSIPLSEMSEFSRAEVYEQQLGDYQSRILDAS